MARIVIELTNRCNLKCQHCFSGRHGGKDDLPLEILQKVLDEARDYGFERLTFTGGDPTVHPQFAEVLRLTVEAGYPFSFVTNGYNFSSSYKTVLPYREALEQITFSLDGATEATHAKLRGPHSYRKVLQAMSLCLALDLPFTNNMVVTRHNRHELETLVKLASKLGSRGLRFGHLMHSPLTTAQGFDLSPSERREVETEIWALQRKYEASLPIAMAPGFFTDNLFPCAPLNLEECNIDCQGNLTKCCHLSSHGEGVGTDDVLGNLREMSFSEGYRRLIILNERFRQAKLERSSTGHPGETDLLPCWYCSNHYQKLDWLKHFEDHEWLEHLWTPSEQDEVPCP